MWMGEYQGRKVAVKVLRIYSTSNLDKIVNVSPHEGLRKLRNKELNNLVQRFCREVVTWKSLRHPNILPLMGVTMGDNRFAMVSEWMTNGNINEFVKAHWDVNRFDLVRICSCR